MLQMARIVMRLLLGGLFLYAGLTKIVHPYDFLVVVYRYEILPEGAGALAAAFLPWLEITIGLALLVSVFVRPALLIASIVASVFVLVQVHVVARGLSVDCGCLGTYALLDSNDATQVSAWTILRTGIFAILSAIGFFLWRDAPTSVNAGGAS